MPKVLDDRPGQFLLQHDDGSVEMVSKSPLNRLLWEYDLFDLLRQQTETLTIEGAADTVTVEPLGNGEFRVDSEEYSLRVPPHHREWLVDTLVDAFDAGDVDAPSVGPVLDALRELLDTDVDPRDVDALADVAPFRGHVEPLATGWFIHEHLLLTYDNEFYHLHTESKQRSGGEVVPAGANDEAYRIRFRGQRTIERSDVDGAAVEFIVRAAWAVDHTTPPA